MTNTRAVVRWRGKTLSLIVFAVLVLVLSVGMAHLLGRLIPFLQLLGILVALAWGRTALDERSLRIYANATDRWLVARMIADNLATVVAVCAVLIAAFMVLRVIFESLIGLILAIPFSRHSMVLVAVGTLSTGCAFFYFRLKQRFAYGATEAIAGVVVAVHRVSLEPDGVPTANPGFYIAVLTAGVYLVVRGLDNMHQALVAEDRFGCWVVRNLRPRPPESAKTVD